MDDILTRGFIESPVFHKKWFDLGLTENDLLELEIELLDNPKLGAVMRGTGRLRKVRVPIDSGKSGGARVLYIDFEAYRSIFFVDVFDKNEKENLSQEERNNIRARIPKFEKELFERIKYE